MCGDIYYNLTKRNVWERYFCDYTLYYICKNYPLEHSFCVISAIFRKNLPFSCKTMHIFY